MNLDIEDGYKQELLGNLNSTLEILYNYAIITNKDTICEYVTIEDLIKRIEKKN